MTTAAKKAQGLLFDIVRDIAAEGLAPGDRLPSQAEMMRRYGAGATPLREALRMLELSGLVSVRPGPAAGAILEEASAEHLAAVVAAFLCLAGVTYGQLMDAWAATEPLLAAAAAANPDRAKVTDELAAFAAEAESDEPVTPTHAIDFHDAVARAAGNPALGLILQVLSYVVADLYWAATDIAAPARLVRHDHHEIAEAILAGDAERARRSMEAHARNTSGGILAHIGRGRDEPLALPPRRVGTATYRQRPLVRGGYASASGSAK
ncbi:FadR/GntR family transcriptional regulator [Phenylobacterium sp.]|uniref:FadR/GntR family transcriptional regulator n=1 Tax=Phenylobacterium sp. TaxID=1871053 RepID=UPI002ED9D9D1